MQVIDHALPGFRRLDFRRVARIEQSPQSLWLFRRGFRVVAWCVRAAFCSLDRGRDRLALLRPGGPIWCRWNRRHWCGERRRPDVLGVSGVGRLGSRMSRAGSGFPIGTSAFIRLSQLSTAGQLRPGLADRCWRGLQLVGDRTIGALGLGPQHRRNQVALLLGRQVPAVGVGRDRIVVWVDGLVQRAKRNIPAAQMQTTILDDFQPDHFPCVQPVPAV
jgi:hypothetical protein